MEIYNKNRSPFVTMICSFYFVYWAISIVGLIAAIIINIGPNFPAFSKIIDQLNLIFLGTQVDVGWTTWIIAAGLVAGVVGYWFYQKWAVIVYAAASIALSVVVLSTIPGDPSKLAYFGTAFYVIASIFAINIAMIVLGIIYFKRMK